jgi:hypothetical protein
MVKNPKTLIKTSEQASEMGRKGGKAKKGYRSLKSVMREILASGEIDVKAYVKSQMVQAMKGNSGMARIQWEHHDGKPLQKIEQYNSHAFDDKVQINVIGAPVREDKPST